MEAVYHAKGHKAGLGQGKTQLMEANGPSLSNLEFLVTRFRRLARECVT